MRLKQTRSGSSDAGAKRPYGTGLSGGSYGSAEGDDLIRSRQFSERASLEMQAIIAADRLLSDTIPASPTEPLPQGRDPEWLCGRLGAIQREAKRARARAVYRSAQDVLQLIQRCSNHMPIDWTRVDGRLFALNKLLGQYDSGLCDVEAQCAVEDDSLSEAEPEGTANSDCGLKSNPDSAVSPTYDPVQEIARQTLTTLLPHASSDEHAALSRLMDLDLTPDLTLSGAADTALSSHDDATSQTEPAAPAAECLEWVMPDLVQDLLALGREFGKIFSVSHSLENIMIEPGKSETVKARIYDGLSGLIAGNLPLQGIGRIDLSASDTGLNISGSGFETFELPLPERVAPQLEALADTLSKTFTPEVPETSEISETSGVRRMITDATEADLRAQLAALMDGGLPEADSP